MDWKALCLNLWGIFWMLAFFGGSIFVHEFGHFIIAKKRGLHVPKFSIGFGPKLFSWKRGETEYCISLLPLGGYVALPQMGEIPILEGSENKPTSVLSFTDKFLVGIMGAVFNLLLAFVLACILWCVGLRVPEQDRCTEVGYIIPEYEGVPTPAAKAGLKPGDIILAIDDRPVTRFSDIEKQIILGAGRDEVGHPITKVTYQRDQQIQHVYLKLMLVETNPITGDTIRFSGIGLPRQRLIVDTFEEGSSAQKCGIVANDEIVQIDNFPIFSFIDLRNYLKKTDAKQVKLFIKRNGELLNIVCETQSIPYLRAWLRYGDNQNYIDFYTADTKIQILETKGKKLLSMPSFGTLISCNGIKIDNLVNLEQVLQTCDQRTLMLEIDLEGQNKFIVVPNFSREVKLHSAESMRRLGIFFKHPTLLIHDNPWTQFKQAIASTIETFSSLVNRNSDVKVQHLMGAPGIMRLLHHFSTNDFRRLLWFIVLLNINLAILNLLPIPVLDGGQILFAILEKIRGKVLPLRWILTIQNSFVILFLGLMAYVIFFDLRRWQGDIEAKQAQQRFEKLLVPAISKH